ncbi:hypothetical protein QE152_g38933 [Popillia japonica]|uniref:Uncharacterized protein n=1 Tax=Popillia japonica TaxID=7064 RepID=A0AAW1HVB4_POPJA
MFGTTEFGTNNITTVIANGDGDASSAHAESTTWVGDNLYAVFASAVGGRVREGNMREININVRLIDGSPRLGCIDDNATIGAMWDTGAQNLAFTRDAGLAGYDMMLHFNTGSDWLEVNVGKANSYTITNALTQSGVLGLRVSFWESSTFRYGSVNTLSFKYKESPQNGSIPEDEISQYLAILGEVSNVKTQIDAVNDSLDNLFPGGTQILRNTNVSTDYAATGLWSNGIWFRFGTAYGAVEKATITDAPNPDIAYGVNMNKTGTGGDLGIRQSNIPLPIGCEYTLSCYARASIAGTIAKLQVGETGYAWVTKEVTLTTEWVKV